MTSVRGGTLEGAATMRAKLNKDGVMDVDTYRNWARTIADAPALIKSEVGLEQRSCDNIIKGVALWCFFGSMDVPNSLSAVNFGPDLNISKNILAHFAETFMVCRGFYWLCWSCHLQVKAFMFKSDILYDLSLRHFGQPSSRSQTVEAEPWVDSPWRVPFLLTVSAQSGKKSIWTRQGDRLALVLL